MGHGRDDTSADLPAMPRDVVSEPRLQQGLATACDGVASPRETGKFLTWLVADVREGSTAEMAALRPQPVGYDGGRPRTRMSMLTGTQGHGAKAMSIVAVLICLGWLREAQAHEVGLSRGVYVANGAEVVAELTFARGELLTLLPALDVDDDGALTDAELAAGDVALQPVIAGFALSADEQPCTATLIDAALTEEDGARLRLGFHCRAAPRRLGLQMPLLASLAVGHRHLASFNGLDGVGFADLVLSRRASAGTAEVPDGLVSAAPPAHPVSAYFEIGVEHILIGTDHLVFLLGLIVIGGRLRSLVAVVTAFTIGHSLSLALATFNVWRPDPGLIEPAIALSIAYVGVENFLVSDAGGRWRISLPFGFIHGFGFAGVLAEIGVPDASVGLALLLFNLGVEAGQLLVLAVLLPLLAVLAARPFYQRLRGARWISAAIVAAGLYWFIERVFL